MLEAHPIKHLAHAGFAARVVQRLDEQQAHHDFGGVRRESARAAISARACRIDLGGNGAESIGSSIVTRLALRTPILAWRWSSQTG